MTPAEQNLSDLMGDRRSIKMFFPQGDYPIGNFVQDGAISLGSPHALSSPTANFTAAVVGLPISVDGAGTAGAILKTTIATFVSSTQVTLTAAASTAVTGAIVWYGTDCSAAINAAITAISNAGGGGLYFPFGFYLVSNPIIMKSNVSIYGEPGYSRYAFNIQGSMLRSVIKASAAFPANGFVIDARAVSGTPVNSIGLYDLEILGDGTGNQNQTDGTTVGIGHGNANLSSTTQCYAFSMERCSIALHKYGVWVSYTNLYQWKSCNIACNAYIGCNFDMYGGNDGTYEGMMINTNNVQIPGVSSPLNDIYTGCGLRLAYGCGYQTWLGGKIEWNATGIVLDQGAFANRFTGVSFDANNKWHLRVIGSNDNIDDPLFTFGNKFVNCRFNGGCYNSSILSAGLDGHIFFDGSYDTTTIYDIPMGADFVGCDFKATPQYSVVERLDVFPQFPQNNVVSSRVTGSPFSGQGNPILLLIMQGCDCSHGSVVSGTWSCSGFTVTGSGFDNSGAWNGKTFWYDFYNQYTIASVTNSTTLLLITSQTLAAAPCFVETNKILVDPDFSGYTDIRIQGCRGLTDYTQRSISDLQAAAEIFNSSAGNYGMKLLRDGTTTLMGPLSAHNLEIDRDVFGTLNIGRQGSGTPIAVIDAASSDGLNPPTSLSLRLASSEFANYSSVTGKLTIQRNMIWAALAGSGNQIVFVDNSGNASIISTGALTLLLSTFTPTAIGLVPGSGGGTSNFLRADGSWVSPAPAGGSVTLAQMANLAANSIIGNNTGSPATPIALTVAQVIAMLGALTSAVITLDGMSGALGITITNSGVGGARLSCVASGGVEAFTLTQPGAWAPYTPTTSNLSSVTSACRFQQIGKTAFVRIHVSATVNSTAPVSLTLPAGLTPFNSNELFPIFEQSTTGGNDGTVPFLPSSGVTIVSNVNRLSGTIVTYDWTGHYETT